MNLVRYGRDMYELLLLAIKKEETSTIYPNQAIWLLNESGIEWLKENSRLVDLNQRQIDDLQDIITEVLPVPPNVVNNTHLLPTDYFQLLSLMVKISDTSDSCIVNSEWQPVHLMKYDRKMPIRVSSYRKPKPSKIYYHLVQGYINFEGATVTHCRYDYFTYIKQITDVTTANPGSTDMSDYSDYILLEIVDRAARIYLERTQNPRYRTILNELALKAQGE